ncbi:MAG: ATP-binding cassette domain-containing protein [Bacteroidales bacterium]|nr:ATP-binding cassette domain-containing protein [Bacteroidales bacterium]
MISIKELTVSYSKRIKILDGLNLNISTGKIHGIAGLNGSGKTTFLNILYGLLKPDMGTIESADFIVSKKNISFLPTENFFYSNITGREYLALFKHQNFMLDKWNELFGLPLDQVVDDYSSGMKKKLAVLGLIKQDKPLMILDEPFNNLDIETNRSLRSLLIKMSARGKTIIITSHIIETLTNLCDQIHHLEGGKIKFTRDKTEFAAFEKELLKSIELKTEGTIRELLG